MKLDRKLHFHSESIKHADNQLNMLRIENEAAWEGKDELTAKKNIKDDTLLHIHVESETLIDENLVNAHHRDALFDVLSDTVPLVGNRTDSNIDGSFTEIKLPEVIVCFEDDARQIVKDICVDDGSHTIEKILPENNVAAYATDDTSSPLKVSATNGNDDLSGRTKDASGTLKQDLSRIQKDQRSQWDRQNTNTDQKDIANSKFSLEQLLSLGEPEGDFKPVDSASFIFSTSHKQSSDEKYDDESMVDEMSFRRMSPKSGPTEANQSVGLNDNPANNTPTGNLLEGFPTITSVVSDAELLKQSNETKEIYSRREVESGTTDPQVKACVAANDWKESGPDTGNRQHFQADPVTETSPDVTNSAQHSFYQSNYSDLHLCGPSYLAGPNTSSGHIAYSGSISVRSDSSTTSNRSFAFPILQPEWNSSPVRMAKADRRYIGKHRRLKSAFFCCKF